MNIRIALLMILLLLSSSAWAESQVDRNLAAEARYEKLKKELDTLYNDIHGRLEEPQKSRFQAAQEAWDVYLEAETYARTTPHIGGLTAIEVHFTTRSELTQVRTGILRQWLEQFSF